ncbi:hypothetical protein BY458DRAFT_559091 [Sporodiniella umbellata]|nr:hypothetical protein BY458DRAFT_559091 [Sporodiniella umbellata]
MFSVLPWAVAAAIGLLIIILLSSYYVFKKKLNKRRTVGTIKHDEKRPGATDRTATTEDPSLSTCHFEDKMELDSEDPYYSQHSFMTVNIEQPKQNQMTAPPSPLTKLPSQEYIRSDERNIHTLPKEKQSYEQPETAARRAIRSASRKSRTRSIVATDGPSVFTHKVPEILTYNIICNTLPTNVQRPAKMDTAGSTEKTIVEPFESSLKILSEGMIAKKSDIPSATRSQKAAQEVSIGSSNVDTIRRMLQSSWSDNHLRTSESNSTISSESIRPAISPIGNFNPPLQNQHIVSLPHRLPTRQRLSVFDYAEAVHSDSQRLSPTTKTMISSFEKSILQ